MSLKWSRIWDWAGLGLLAAVAITLVFLLLTSAVERGAEYWARLLLTVVFGLAIIAAWVNRPSKLARTKVVGSRAPGKWLAFLVLALFSSVSLAVDVLSLFAPTPVVESSPGAIEGKVDAIAQAMPRALEPSPIRDKIVGVWGEQDCAVSFKFVVHGDALMITAQKAPPGVARYQSVATITSAKGDVLEARGDDFQAARFAYWTNGIDEQLTWDDARDTPPSKFRRCPAKP